MSETPHCSRVLDIEGNKGLTSGPLEGVVPIGCAGSNPADRTIPQTTRKP